MNGPGDRLAPEQRRRMRVAVRSLINNPRRERGDLMRLANWFGVSRQRIDQIAAEERKR